MATNDGLNDGRKAANSLYPLQYLWWTGIGLGVLAFIGVLLSQGTGTHAAVGIGLLIGVNPAHAVTSIDGAVSAANTSAKTQLHDARRSYSLVGAVWLDEPDNPNEDPPNCFSCHDTRDKGPLQPKRISVSHVFRRFAMEPLPQ